MTNSLLNLTKKIKEFKPWVMLDDVQIFGIEDPKTKITHFISVMGKGGTYFAIAMYTDLKGLKSFYNLLTCKGRMLI